MRAGAQYLGRGDNKPWRDSPKSDSIKPGRLNSMERRVRGNFHARCGAGENLEITSKDYLSLSGAKSQGIKQFMAN